MTNDVIFRRFNVKAMSKHNGYNATTERDNKGKNIRFWRPLSNNIKFLCITLCVSEVLFHMPKIIKIVQKID